MTGIHRNPTITGHIPAAPQLPKSSHENTLGDTTGQRSMAAVHEKINNTIGSCYNREVVKLKESMQGSPDMIGNKTMEKEMKISLYRAARTPGTQWDTTSLDGEISG